MSLVSVCEHFEHFLVSVPFSVQVGALVCVHLLMLCPVAGILSVVVLPHLEQVPVFTPAAVQVGSFVTVAFEKL